MCGNNRASLVELSLAHITTKNRVYSWEFCFLPEKNYVKKNALTPFPINKKNTSDNFFFTFKFGLKHSYIFFRTLIIKDFT